MVLAFANFVAVPALPGVLPDVPLQLPVTGPVSGPLKVAVIVVPGIGTAVCQLRPALGIAIFALPSKDTPAMVLAFANFVAVPALPGVLPDVPLQLPVTGPVSGPLKVAVIVVPGIGTAGCQL